MKLRRSMPVWCAMGLAVSLPGCGTAAEGEPFERGTGTVVGSDGVPETPRLDYPPPPYGTVAGDVIQDLGFVGWMRPADVGYDTAALSPVNLATFHEASRAAGVRFLVITAGASWCVACKAEYEDLATGIVASYEERGVAFLGTLFEDEDYAPAKPSDLKVWAEDYSVTFPFVLDPGLKLGGYFDVAATPMSMIIDTQTMQILRVETGWAGGGEGSLFALLDDLLGS